ncbi:MAG: GNAT family N-acetyltransferase [Thermomicrobiales bacterium]
MTRDPDTTSSPRAFGHRPGTVDDLDALMGLFDAAVEWLVARGQPEQWGSEPWSADPAKVDRIRGFIEDGDLWVAVDEADRVVGATIVNEVPMPYVEAVNEPELYVRLLISDPAYRGANIGGELLERGKAIARERGIDLLRVDCFAGGGGSLVRYYESQGFQRVHPFDVKGWPGMLLAQRVLTGASGEAAQPH